MYAIIGDVHSQSAPLREALSYCREHNLIPLLLGDLFDTRTEKSDSVGVLNLVQEAQENLGAIVLRSNHQNKLERFLKGNNVTMNNIDRTLKDFKEANLDLPKVLDWLQSFPYGVVFRDSEETEYRCAHALFPSQIVIPKYDTIYKVEQVTKKSRDLMLYGPTTRGDAQGVNRRVFWWENESDREWVRVAGHYHVVHISDQSLVLDGGMGGSSREDEPTPNGVDTLCLWDVELKKLVQFEE